MNRRPLSLFLLAGSSILLLTALLKVVDEVLDKGFGRFDIPIIQAVYSLRQAWLTPWMFRLSGLGNHGLIAIGIATLLILLFVRRFKEAATFFGVAGGGLLLSLLLKNLIARPRPTISPLAIERTFSFPSGHSMNSAIIYGLLAFGIWYFTRNRTLGAVAGIAAAALVLSIGFSRVYLGVHYPSDVLGGYLAGIWWLITVRAIVRIWQHRYPSKS